MVSLFIAKQWSGIAAKVAELVDALDLGSSTERCESSSLSFRTSLKNNDRFSDLDLRNSLWK